ncbi:GATA-type zinc finger transcription factor [Phycomyces blakesleeanus]|uniref:GATA-type zinc finger transcription factor n=2 Tax=Phycomyces blakesleeanus TaxID=4837 RepID=A0A163CUJ3_PHYB8|nr:GATA-type zinc finger transcription factor [Phycomyces blakesleeanus NRRL 1555(-)]OAD65680.1 GATA-type zinc finger transcription factor [Phycomyces blakesleeanus NRRL 1555(-)]|eukprot:XP_018283720.1 GATA-type zinc finger transcription factor [Phycomyces blakesleeanus NRRL 1555(-)]
MALVPSSLTSSVTRQTVPLPIIPTMHSTSLDLRHIHKDLDLVYNCTAQIQTSLLDSRSQNNTVNLPSLQELDSLIDSAGRMIRVLDDAKHLWSQSPTISSLQRHTKEIKSTTNTILQCHSCNSTQSPEWRKGPMGPRTLCNACGLIWAKLSRRQPMGPNKTQDRSNMAHLIHSRSVPIKKQRTKHTSSLKGNKHAISFLLS